MENKWTDAQKAVIETGDKNLLVSAAAGAGKTTVLVARIIRMITDKDKPVDLDRLVIITFTRAAAAQMKQKISDALEKLIEAEPENALYRRQYRLLGNASICTIDSFCLNIVRAYFQKLDLDPAFRIADETELKLVESDCMDELMEKYHTEASPEFINLLESYCGYKSDDALTGYILNLAGKAEAMPWPKEWLDALVKDYEIESADEFNRSGVAENICNHVKSLIKGILARIDIAEKLCTTGDGAPDYIPAITGDKTQISAVLEAKDYTEIGEKIKAIKFGTLSTKRSGDAAIKDRIKNIRDNYKDSIKQIKNNFFFISVDNLIDLLKLSLPSVRCLVNLTKDYLDLFAAKKKEKNVIDFSDAEHFALNILWGETPEALELRKQYSEIIIDEYQDSNNVQEYIANAIAGNASEAPYIFTVGDVKQSIYKFRNACPELFVSKQKKYAKEEDNGKLVILDNNFRSREEVLDSTNAVFKHVMRESIGGIDYDDECSLKKGSDKQSSLGEDSPYKTEVHIISKELEETYEPADAKAHGAGTDKLQAADADTTEPDDNDETESVEAEDNKRVLEARLIANRIKTLVYKEKLQVADEDNEGNTRDIRFKDIVILLRTMKDWSSVFVETLEAEGVPVFSDESDGFFKSREVALIIDLLRILDNPRNDISFAAVLHSCVGGMDEDELADIRINAKDAESFYDAALKIYRDETDSPVAGELPVVGTNGDAAVDLSAAGTNGGTVGGYKEKLIRFFSLYRELEEFKQTSSVSELIDKIYNRTGIYDYFSAFPDGERRKANLDMLPAYAVDFENTSYSGLFGFIRYYDKLKNNELDYGEAGARTMADCVHIMSIHKSKGLEFPVVFVAGMGKQFNLKDFSGDICISSDHGIGIKYVDVERRIKYPSFYHSVIKMRGTEGLIGEEMRLLYVAMTRAKDKLIMTGYTDKVNQATDYAALYKSKNFMDFVYPVLIPEKKYFDTVVYSVDTVSGMTGEDVPVTRNTAPENGIALAIPMDFVKGSDKESLEEKIKRARDVEYEYKYLEALPVKLSVSDLKHQMIEEEFGENVFEETREFLPGDKTLPDFLKTGEKLSRGTDYGTLVHKCMQFMPMSAETDVRDFLTDMQAKGRLSSEEAGKMPVNKFITFLNSPLADRIRKAEANGQFYREKQFMILVNAKDINADKYGESEEKVPVQGVIDAMFIEDGEIVILDYKTDRVDTAALKPDVAATGTSSIGNGQPEGDTPEDRLIKLYKTQLDLYAQAAERLLGRKVKEKLLYSFSLEKEIRVV
ncbi:MAG: UvrD-helicase domain-containing protein [Lachnospiraceae bacterium]|nr:UvrD-helicase domain-containing protein [Lachnospiraceae bacterium]